MASAGQAAAHSPQKRQRPKSIRRLPWSSVPTAPVKFVTRRNVTAPFSGEVVPRLPRVLAPAVSPYGFVVVYPDGVGGGASETDNRTWNAGICCGAAARQDVDDVAFVDQLALRGYVVVGQDWGGPQGVGTALQRRNHLAALVQRGHGLLQRRLGVRAMRVEDVDVLQAHALQALVEARQHVFARAAALAV